MTRCLTWLCAVLTVALGATVAQAQRYPDKPIRVIYPYQAGGTGDIVLRLIQPALEQRLGQRLVIEARPGAGGNIGAQQVANAPADGYTLLLGATNNFAVNQYIFKSMGFDPLKAFAPITVLVDVPSVFYASTETPARSLPEFVSWARQIPGKVNFSSPGIGTTPHLNAELFAQRAGLQLVHVPYKGLVDAMNAVMTNEVQLYLAGLGPGLGHLKTGKLRALAVGSAKRLAALPDTPTLDESGFKGLVASNWFGFAAPARTEPAIIKRIAEEVSAALAAPEVGERLSALGLVPGGESPADFARRIEREAKLWESVVRTAQIRTE